MDRTREYRAGYRAGARRSAVRAFLLLCLSTSVIAFAVQRPLSWWLLLAYAAAFVVAAYAADHARQAVSDARQARLLLALAREDVVRKVLES